MRMNASQDVHCEFLLIVEIICNDLQWVVAPAPSSPGRLAPKTPPPRTGQPAWRKHTVSTAEVFQELRKRLTLLCTSQGLVMADKSQAVIIMALQWQNICERLETMTCTIFFFGCVCIESTHMTISFLVVSRDMKSTHFFSSSYVCERSTIFWNMVLFLACEGKGWVFIPAYSWGATIVRVSITSAHLK